MQHFDGLDSNREPYGILLIDKPAGWTSHDVVQKTRSILKTKAIGHSGTLDPFATGLLVLCVGKATKLVKFFTEHDKTYEAEVVLGVQTDTDDLTGHILRQIPAGKITDRQIEDALQEFIGPMMQDPPAYSAIKINGKKLYQYARNNQDSPKVMPREVVIKSINLLGIEKRSESTITLRMTMDVSKGTYIRAFARDLGNRLGVGACLAQLNRLRVGNYHLTDAAQIDELNTGQIHLLDPLSGLGLSRMIVDQDWVKKIENGVMMPSSLFIRLEPHILVSPEGYELAIYEPDEHHTCMRMSVKLS
jgi:tRNA pseudouridine55 synthase